MVEVKTLPVYKTLDSACGNVSFALNEDTGKAKPFTIW